MTTRSASSVRAVGQPLGASMASPNNSTPASSFMLSAGTRNTVAPATAVRFRAAGFDWRGAGCSMCLGMNPDVLAPGERCASTSNRNFEGRQGKGGRTHLVSPEVAAATAVTGHLAAPADL